MTRKGVEVEKERLELGSFHLYPRRFFSFHSIRSFRSSIAPLPRQSSPLPFTTFMSLRLSDGSVAYGTSEERMNVGKRRCQLPACTVRLLFGSCVTSRHPHSSLTHIVVTFSLPHPTRDRSERGEKWQGEGP
jgi:hypothetical protein